MPIAGWAIKQKRTAQDQKSGAIKHSRGCFLSLLQPSPNMSHTYPPPSAPTRNSNEHWIVDYGVCLPRRRRLAISKAR